MEDITGMHYPHTKRVCKDFEIKNLGEYQDFYVQSDTISLFYYCEKVFILLLRKGVYFIIAKRCLFL